MMYWGNALMAMSRRGVVSSGTTCSVTRSAQSSSRSVTYRVTHGRTNVEKTAAESRPLSFWSTKVPTGVSLIVRANCSVHLSKDDISHFFTPARALCFFQDISEPWYVPA